MEVCRRKRGIRRYLYRLAHVPTTLKRDCVVAEIDTFLNAVLCSTSVLHYVTYTFIIPHIQLLILLCQSLCHISSYRDFVTPDSDT